MNEVNNLTRRQFLTCGMVAAVGITLPGDFYAGTCKCDAKVWDIVRAGQVLNFDGMRLKIECIATQLTTNP